MIRSTIIPLALLLCAAFTEGCRDKSSEPGTDASPLLFVKELDASASAGIVLDGNYVYFQTNDGVNPGKLYKISKNGQEVTTYASGGQSFGIPTITGSCIVTTSTTAGIRVFEKSTGQLRWSKPSRDPLVLATVDETTVFVTEPGSIRALRLSDGITVWETTIRGKSAFNPVVDGDRVYFATGGLHRQDGYLYCVNKSNGSIAFQDTLPYMESRSQWGGSAAGVEVWNEFVLVPGDNWYFYSFDKNDGALVWRFLADAPMETPPRVNNGTVFFGSLNQTCFAVDAENGTGLWSYSTGGSLYRVPPSFHGNKVSFTSGRLIILDRSSGSRIAELARSNTGYWFFAAVFDSDGRVYCTGGEHGSEKQLFMVFQF